MKPSPAPRPTVAQLLPAASALVAALGLGACGGGGSSSAPAPAPAPTPASLSLTGVVAKGAALSGATISAKCATGTGTATSGTDGSYTLSVTGGALPCVLEAVSGTDKLHSAATTAKANITPLTELMVAQLTGQAPAAWFATAASLGTSVTTAKLADAQTAVLAVLTAAGLDTSKAGDFVSGALVAASGSTAGSDQDKVLDALGSKLMAAGTTLADLSSTVAVSGSTTTPTTTPSALAPELLLKPAAASCSALRATDYWAVISGVTGGGAVQKVKISIDANKAATLTPYTTADGTALGSAVTLTANGNCRFTSSQGDDIMVAPSGVIVATNSASRAIMAVPVQAHTLAELAGDWNVLGSDTADSAVNGIGWTFGYGTVSINAAGYEQFTQGCWYDTLTTTCGLLPDAIKTRKRPVAMLADGSFTKHSDDSSAADGGPWMDRSFVYRSGQGDYIAISSNVLTPGGKGDGSVGYGTKVRTLTLPAAGDANNNWNVYWNWATGTSTTATDVNTHKIQSVDSAAASFVRVSGVAGAATHAETLLVNKPFAGFWQRDAASNVATSDGKTTNVRAGVFLKAGSGVTVVLQPYQDANRPARIVLAVAKPD